MSRLKTLLRDAIPPALQVPLKYHLNRWSGRLEPEMTLLRHVVRQGEHVIDVGGNRGAYAFRLAQLGARVEVFEPNPACHGVLRAWAEGGASVTVHPCGLSDHAGAIALHIPVDEAGVEHDASASMEPHAFARARDQIVDLRTLDSFGFRDVAFIKIDVEGHEAAVLRGAAETIRASKPTLLVEIEQRHLQCPIQEVFGQILSFGYEGYFLERGLLRSIAEFTLERDQLASNFARTGARYINNFLFQHKEGLDSVRSKVIFAIKGQSS